MTTRWYVGACGTITTSPENPASCHVIEKAGGTFVRAYSALKALVGHNTLEFRVSLTRNG